MRISLEPLAVRITMPQLNSADVETLAACQARMAEALHARDLASLTAPHMMFHSVLVSRAGGRLVAVLDELRQHAERYRYLYVRAASLDIALFEIANTEHDQMLLAARERDAVTCAALVARQFARTAAIQCGQIDGGYEAVRLQAALDQALIAVRPMPQSA